jgi:hypothetical protein
MRTFRLPQLAETGTHPRSGARAALRFSTAFAAALPLLSPGAAGASETLSYNYDARGRLVEVDHSGSVNDGIATSYTLDNADNRTSMTVGEPTPPPPPAPSFAISNATITEGGSLVFTVTKTGSTSSSLSVDYATSNGTAAAGSDYTAKSGTLTFTSTQTSKTISVATTDDTLVEGSETMKVTLSGATGGATISDALGTGTITDNDTVAAPSFSVSNASANEGNLVAFTITKTGSTSSSYSVSYASANNGSAVAGTDYGAVSGTVTFTASQTSKTVFVQTYNDSASEGNETFVLNLSAPSGGATISDGQGVGTIFNVDPPDPNVCFDEFGQAYICP